jgi:hypothetical protein
MIKRFAFSFMLFAVAALAADPTLVGLVMPDAKILTGIQVDRSQASPFGQYVLAKTQFNDPGFLKFVADTGFDPRNDLREIVAATGGTEQNSIVLGRGSFQPSKIAASALANGGSVTKYKGIDIILTDKSGNSVIAFLDSSIGLFGNLAAVQATIDRRASGAMFNGALAQKAQAVSATNHAWFVTLTPLSEFLAGKTGESQVNTMMQSNLLQAVQSASGGLTFGSNAVTVSAEAVTRSDKDAQALNDVLKFLVGMLQGGGAQNGLPAAAATLANSVQISTDGATLKLSLSLPEAQAEELFMGAPGAPGAKATPKRKAAAR